MRRRAGAARPSSSSQLVEQRPDDVHVRPAGVLDLAGGERDPQALLQRVRPCSSPRCQRADPTLLQRVREDRGVAQRRGPARSPARPTATDSSPGRRGCGAGTGCSAPGRAAGRRRPPPARRSPPPPRRRRPPGPRPTTASATASAGPRPSAPRLAEPAAQLDRLALGGGGLLAAARRVALDGVPAPAGRRAPPAGTGRGDRATQPVVRRPPRGATPARTASAAGRRAVAARSRPRRRPRAAWCTIRDRSAPSRPTSAASTRRFSSTRRATGIESTTARRASSCRNAHALRRHRQQPALLGRGQRGPARPARAPRPATAPARTGRRRAAPARRG